MGFRIGTGLGPFSVSARIGGGGGGGGGGDGLGWLLFGGGVLVFGPTIIWILELDWSPVQWQTGLEEYFFVVDFSPHLFLHISVRWPIRTL